MDSAAAFLRDELQKTENIVKIKEVIVHDSRDDEEDDEDDFYCYYVGSRKNTDNEATWQKFYGTDSGLSSAESANSAVLDSLIVDIYRNNEYRKLADGENASEEEIAYKDFTLSVKKAGTSGNTIGPLKTSVRLWMTDDYKIKAVISDTVTADDKKEERCEKRLELEAAHSSESETVTVAGDDGDSDDDDSYTITTTTIITTIRWQNGTIEKELLEQDGQNSGSEKKTVGAKTTIKEGTVRQPILSRMLGKLRANAGETLTEVLISVLVIALGMTMFLSAFLASGRMLQQGEEQMAGYYDSRNQLENNRTAEQASGRYVLELESSGTGGMKKSLASNAYQTGTQTNYRTGQYPIVLYMSQADSDAEEEKVNLQDLLYRYR